MKNIIRAARPTGRIILPPAAAVLPISLDEALTTDLRELHARAVATAIANGQAPQDFDDWFKDILREVVDRRSA